MHALILCLLVGGSVITSLSGVFLATMTSVILAEITGESFSAPCVLDYASVQPEYPLDLRSVIESCAVLSRLS
jgi:hypothetical protein